ncbi:MAG: hypothetical protein LC768_13575 [Acidobacteria bacterium]|nr:hypothetical protein [Acidobacteriota bacterium]MCA1639340.1 hypothetical protein [Acidobacteriota bacterium]
MLEITNQELFGKVIADALAKVEQTVTDNQTKQRWINAISKAAAEIEENGVFMTWQDEEQSLLIWSQKSNHIYSANGVCQCRAFDQGSPCFHRAAARLVRLYIEAENNPAPVRTQAEEMNVAPYLKPTIEREVERVGNVRIN